MNNSNLQQIAKDGVAAWQRGDAAGARRAFDGVAQAGAATPQLWLLLAQACGALSDAPAEEAALDQVLAADPRNPYALTMKGDCALARGDDRAAGSFYQMALASAPEGAALTPDLKARLDKARTTTESINARYRAHTDAALNALPNPGARFAEAIDILIGEKPIYVQQPTNFYYPGLAHTPFFDAADFAWVKTFEDAVSAMRAELQAVIARDTGFRPYVEGEADRPNRGHALLDDRRWSAFHLWQGGVPVAENAAQCPATMAALDAAPMPRTAGRSPMALFSVLRPHTHIPPHNGMLNTRLICHIPLIVPDGCRLRVGNEMRAVEAGKAMIFDDSIEHEAWNDSDETRVVLLFEIWRPDLSEAERNGLTALFDAIDSYPSGASAFKA